MRGQRKHRRAGLGLSLSLTQGVYPGGMPGGFFSFERFCHFCCVRCALDMRYSALFVALLLWELSSARVCFVFRVFVWCERARRYLRRSFVCVTLCVSVVCCVLACTAGARAQRV